MKVALTITLETKNTTCLTFIISTANKMIIGGVETTSMNSPTDTLQTNKPSCSGDKFYINQVIEFEELD
jgi:hypothetical protein